MVPEQWSNGNSIPRHIRVAYIICSQLFEIVFYLLHLIANGQAAILIPNPDKPEMNIEY
jgi:hypothetical protein